MISFVDTIFLVIVILNYVLIFIVLMTIIKHINFVYIIWLPQHYLPRSATARQDATKLRRKFSI